LDSGNVGIFKKNTGAIINSDVSAVILDFSQTKFIDSIGLGSLVSILKQTAHNNISIILCSLSPQVRQIFELTRLYRLFNIFESLEDAEKSIIKPE
jgi:anti-sigma B factor antagonist